MEEVTTILTGEDEERNGGFSERLTPHYQLRYKWVRISRSMRPS